MRKVTLQQFSMLLIATIFTACGDPKEDCLAAAAEWDLTDREGRDYADDECSQSDECAEAITRNIDGCTSVYRTTGQKNGVFICAAVAASIDGHCD